MQSRRVTPVFSSNGARLRAIAASAVLPLFLAVVPAEAHQPHDAFYTVATSPNFSQDRTVLIGSDYLTITIGVYLVMKSTDGGTTWKVLRDLPNFPTYAIDFSPNFQQDGVIYLAGLNGVYRSADRGETWAALPGQPFTQVRYMGMSPAFPTDHTLIAVTSDGLAYRTVDAGGTWQQLSVAGASGLTEVKFSPNYASDKTIIIGSTSSGIFKSTDGGDNWTRVTSGQTLASVSTLAISPNFASDGTAFAGTSGSGMYRSTDSGNTWQADNSGLTESNVTSLAISPDYATDSTLWVSTATNGVARSIDGGLNWLPPTIIRRELSDQTTTHYRDLAVTHLPGGGLKLFIAMFEGVWWSANSGAYWSYSDTIPAYLFRKMTISPAYGTDHTFLASTYGGGSLWSYDGGASFQFHNVGLNNSYPDSVGISPNFPVDGIAYHGTVPGLNRITKSAPNWAQMPGAGATSFPRALAISSTFAQDHTLYTGTDNLGTMNPATIVYQGQTYSNQGVFVSHDAGYSWAPTGLNGPRTDFVAISPNFSNDGTLFASTADSGFYKTTNAGATWTNIPVVPGEKGYLHVVISPNYASDHTVLVATQHYGIYKSVDSGASWGLIADNSILTALDMIISPNYAADGTILISTLQSGLLVSTDSGASFHPSTLGENYITAMVFSPAYSLDHTIIASTYHGLYKSANSGATWTFLHNPGRTEEERDVTIAYQGTWTTVGENTSGQNLIGYSCRRIDVTTQPQASATFYFYGSGVDWLAAVGPTYGSAYVKLDGVLQPGPINLNAPSVLAQQTMFKNTSLTCGAHTLTIISSGQPGQGTINLDALDVYRTGCN
jgi:photosystem II stability/assembly factor-like uncharacterized protein